MNWVVHPLRTKRFPKPEGHLEGRGKSWGRGNVQPNSLIIYPSIGMYQDSGNTSIYIGQFIFPLLKPTLPCEWEANVQYLNPMRIIQSLFQWIVYIIIKVTNHYKMFSLFIFHFFCEFYRILMSWLHLRLGTCSRSVHFITHPFSCLIFGPFSA